ncbi:MAG: hypothetical protein SPK00_01675 [Corynebacterium glucuronolyticum]|nr:hypothetical protein [Mycobacteriaceae bacterium]MDY5833447.1 hypothetical protein [Corynebacterium glucuronolyticum]
MPVYLPDNEDGDVLTKELAASEMETCDPMVNPRVPEETRVEKVHGRYLLFTVKDGPSKIEDGLPVGYSHTPAGAATALYNASAVLTPVNADGSPDSTSQAAANKLYEPKLGDLPSGDQVYSLKDAGFPFYFRVLGCNSEVVTVEYGVGYRSGEVVATIRSQAVWRDGDWKFNVMAPTDGEAATKEDVVGWASWKIG